MTEGRPTPLSGNAVSNGSNACTSLSMDSDWQAVLSVDHGKWKIKAANNEYGVYVNEIKLSPEECRTLGDRDTVYFEPFQETTLQVRFPEKRMMEEDSPYHPPSKIRRVSQEIISSSNECSFSCHTNDSIVLRGTANAAITSPTTMVHSSAFQREPIIMPECSTRNSSEEDIMNQEDVADHYVNIVRDISVELECNICGELFIEPTTLMCTHTFCQWCLLKWRKHTCPLCREPIECQVQSLLLDRLIGKMIGYLPLEIRKHREKVIEERIASSPLSLDTETSESSSTSPETTETEYSSEYEIDSY